MNTTDEARRRLLFASLLSGSFGTTRAFARESSGYPARPVTLLVGFPPGGSGDFVARVVASKLSEALGQPFLVENRGGANGLIASNAVAAAAADGYTLLLTSMGLTTNPHLYRQGRGDPARAFTPVAMLASIPNVIVSNASVPARSLTELLSLARTRSGSRPMTLATTGNAAPGHLAGELLQRATQVRFEYVAYRGSGPALSDLIAGHVDLSVPTVVAAAPHIKSGALRAFAVTGRQRSPLLPDVPTFAEAGVSGLEASSGWYGLVGPLRVPAEIVQTLGEQLRKVMLSRDVQDRFGANGADPTYLGPADMAAFVAREYRRWGDLIRERNIKAEE
jgi:tripartite-type tricarboxylate transporter receptor subunit TctC